MFTIVDCVFYILTYMSTCRRKCLVMAETRCYEAIIKTTSKETPNEALNENEEIIIEED